MDILGTATSLLGAVNPATSIASTLTQGVSSMFGGEEDAGAANSAATGTFNAGSVNITKADDTIKIAMIIGGLVLVAAIFFKFRR